MLTADILRERLYYDPETGLFTWVSKKSPKSRVKVGTTAGTIESYGYRIIKLYGKIYKAHRLAWLYMTGEWPAELIDHINGNRSDNRWGNLREATPAQNVMNMKPVGASGAKGVCWHKKDKKWQAAIRHRGTTLYLGQFNSRDEAARVYAVAARDLFGEFARTV